MLILLRSLVFDCFFYIGTAVYLALYFPILPFLSRKYVYLMYQKWTGWVLGMLKLIVRLTYQIEGIENLKLIKGRCIIACKHQSVWETLVFSQILDDFHLVTKKELLSIPIYGPYLKKLSIALDRSQGAQSLRHLYKEIKKRDPLPILLFPEGKRQPVFERQSQYQPGISFLYKNLHIPVFPVALNSGCFWKRKAFIKQPGIITLKFLPPVEPGLSVDDFMQTLTKTLEDATHQLLVS